MDCTPAFCGELSSGGGRDSVVNYCEIAASFLMLIFAFFVHVEGSSGFMMRVIAREVLEAKKFCKSCVRLAHMPVNATHSEYDGRAAERNCVMFLAEGDSVKAAREHYLPRLALQSHEEIALTSVRVVALACGIWGVWLVIKNLTVLEDSAHPVRVKVIYSLSIAVLLVGCASRVGQIDKSKWSHVRPGMTRDEVISNLGSPRATAAQGHTEILTYVEDAGVLVTRGTGIWQRYYVELTDGKVSAYGSQDQPPPHQVAIEQSNAVDAMTRDKKLSEWSTSRLQLRRQQLAEAIPDVSIKVGLFGPDFTNERREKEQIEMELLRRFEAGDAAAEIKPLVRDDQRKVRVGN
jgi:outer membrane protein assembly factor BamE (lipoprotein component of BamABCDE complex)